MRNARIGIRFTLAGLLLAVWACTATTFQSTWRNPDPRPLKLQGSKAVALFMSNRPAIRRIAEDALAREISARGAQGTPAGTILSDEEIKPGYLREDRVVTVETLVYSFLRDDLMWAGVSKTTNPENIESFIQELAKAVSKKMEKDGLLKPA